MVYINLFHHKILILLCLDFCLELFFVHLDLLAHRIFHIPLYKVIHILGLNQLENSHPNKSRYLRLAMR